MTRGKRTCKILKEIRQQIADNNDIEYVTSECHFQGECKGTCPKCEAEVKYLENELNKRQQLGKVVTIAGISLGVVGSFSGCNSARQNDETISEPEKQTEIPIQTVRVDSLDTSSIHDFSQLPQIYSIIGDVENAPFHDFEIEEEKTEEFEPVYVGGIDAENKNGDDYFMPEILPEYPGGDDALLKFLEKNVVYPQKAKDKGVKGRVVVTFVIETDGSVSNVKIVRSQNPDLDAEAIRVVRLMPKWKPAKDKGENSRATVNLPIDFILED